MAFRTGYGVGLYSADAYGIDSKLVEGAASGAGTSAVAVSYERIRETSVSASSASVGAVGGYTALSGQVADTAAGTVAISYNRVRLCSASDSAAIDARVISRYKWLDTSVSAVTWADANYREGAA